MTFITILLYSILIKFVFFSIIYLTLWKKPSICNYGSIWSLSFLTDFFITFFYFKKFTHGNLILFGMVLAWILCLHYKIYTKNKLSNSLSQIRGSQKFILPNFFVIMAISILMSSCFIIYLFSPSFGWSAPFWNVPLLGVFLVGITLNLWSTFTTKNLNEDLSENNNFISKNKIRPEFWGELLVWLSFGLLALPFTYGTFGLISPLALLYSFKSTHPYS